jgi:hypothetical protein
MSDNDKWLTKPENFRALRHILRRIRDVYGTDVRVTCSEDLAVLARYRDSKDIELRTMLLQFESRVPLSFGGQPSTRTQPSTQQKRSYRGAQIPDDHSTDSSEQVVRKKQRIYRGRSVSDDDAQ